MAEGERFFCSRTGVKDWARRVEQESRRASGSRLRRIEVRVANCQWFLAGEGQRCVLPDGLPAREAVTS